MLQAIETGLWGLELVLLTLLAVVCLYVAVLARSVYGEDED